MAFDFSDIDLLKDVEESIENRVAQKKKYDSMITLSNKDTKENTYHALKDIKLKNVGSKQTVRLLDEGMLTYEGGEPRLYIEKGSLKRYYDNLSDDFIGHINLGHMEFAEFPFILGKWSKKDLKLVDIGNGRQALDVTMNLDDKSVFINEMRRMNYPVAVSSEFSYKLDYEATEKLGFEVINNLDIFAFAIVGNPGNAQSGNIRLKGVSEEMADSFIKKMFQKHLETVEKPVDDVTEEVVEDVAEEKNVEEVVEDVAEVVEEIMGDAEEVLSAMDKKIEELKAENESLKSEKKQLEEKLSTIDKGTEVVDRMKQLVAKYGREKTTKKYVDKENKVTKQSVKTPVGDDVWGL